ncbi:aspartyl protease family protein [Algoriphagus sp. SE2]|uniref:aspartyl protease family protein n=1 Tax=Algoriphagus sp. SE2 TaxID=3141536 RepID=UPI0031CD92E5
MKIVVSLFFCLIYSGIVNAQIPGFFMKEERRKVDIPFYASNNLIIVTVSINGTYPINFLVDTGVRANILFSKNLGDAMDLSYSRKLNLVGADGAASLVAFVSPTNHLDLGPVEGVFQNLLVLEEDFLELEAVIGIPVYGIIGYEFFKYNPVKIDYDKGIISFYEKDAMKWRPPFYKKVPMSIENHKPYITAKVRQQTGPVLNPKLLIDTGANHGLLLNKETSEDIRLPELFIETELGQSLGGELFGFVGRVRDLNISGFHLNDVLTSYPEETPFSYVIKESGRQGSIGAEVLGRMKLIFDYPRERLLIHRGEQFYAAFEYDMSGIEVKKVTNDEHRMYVGQVRDNSPASKAGILAFDEILSINKIPIIIWELSEVIKLFRSEEGKEIELEIRRYEGLDLTKYEDMRFRIVLKKQI